MKIIELSSIVLLVFTAANAQTSRTCTYSSLHGVCIPYHTCNYTKRQGNFLNPEELLEIRGRLQACSAYGRGLVCCEKPEEVVHIPTETPTATDSSEPPVATTISSDVPIDHTQHPKYSLFKDLKCGGSASNRVANGNDSSLFEFPWAARLGFETLGELSYGCGGSVISEYYVLTAAHCLVGLPVRNSKLATVRLGDWDTSKDKDCDLTDPEDPECADPVQDISVSGFMAHPQYDASKIINDIGFVQLAEAAKFKQNNIKPICLPFTIELQQLPARLIVIGWGRTEKSRSAEILQKAGVPLYDHDKCVEKFSSLSARRKLILTDGQFCAGAEGKVDACRGDSGSSIQSFGLVNGKQKMVQFGIVSYGIKTCGIQEGYPGIYTRVSKYIGWLLDSVQ